MSNTTKLESTEKEALKTVLSSVWGTIGPNYSAASKCLADLCGVRYGIAVFSASAALETILRALNIGFGDEVLTAAWSDPLDSLICSAVSARPVFCDVCKDTFAFSADEARKHLSAKTKAVIVDLPAGNVGNLAAISRLCRENGLYFILNIDDAYNAQYDGKPVASYADAAFVNLSQGKALDVGKAGGVVTDNEKIFNLCFAYHNCGRPFGEGCSLSFDQIIGGDLRIAEWQACLIPIRAQLIKEKTDYRKACCRDIIATYCDCLQPVVKTKGSESSVTGMLLRFLPGNSRAGTPEQAVQMLAADGLSVSQLYLPMYSQPFLQSDYYQKCTGAAEALRAGRFPASDEAANCIYIDLRGRHDK